jgi:hypothetical protein
MASGLMSEAMSDLGHWLSPLFQPECLIAIGNFLHNSLKPKDRSGFPIPTRGLPWDARGLQRQQDSFLLAPPTHPPYASSPFHRILRRTRSLIRPAAYSASKVTAATPVAMSQALSVLKSRLQPLIHRNLNDVANGEGASSNTPVTGTVSSALTIPRFGATIAL